MHRTTKYQFGIEYADFLSRERQNRREESASDVPFYKNYENSGRSWNSSSSRSKPVQRRDTRVTSEQERPFQRQRSDNSRRSQESIRRRRQIQKDKARLYRQRSKSPDEKILSARENIEYWKMMLEQAEEEKRNLPIDSGKIAEGSKKIDGKGQKNMTGNGGRKVEFHKKGNVEMVKKKGKNEERNQKNKQVKEGENRGSKVEFDKKGKDDKTKQKNELEKGPQEGEMEEEIEGEMEEMNEEGNGKKNGQEKGDEDKAEN